MKGDAREVARLSAPLEPTLRLVRQATRVSLKEFAKGVGVTPKAILDYEGGKRQPTIMRAQRHAEALGIELPEYNALWAKAHEEWTARKAAAKAAAS